MKKLLLSILYLGIAWFLYGLIFGDFGIDGLIAIIIGLFLGYDIGRCRKID